MGHLVLSSMRSLRLFFHAARVADQVLFWPVLALVIWGELSPPRDFGLFAFLLELNDKALHFLAYFALGWMAAVAARRRESVILAVIGLIVLGGVLEILEHFVGRDMELADEIANTLGALSGAFLARVIVEPLRRRFAYS